MNWTAQTIDHRARHGTIPFAHSAETLASIHEDARRERLLDLEDRLRPYRVACFAILAAALVIGGTRIGWWWTLPLAAGFAGFAVADRFMRASAHPAAWVAAAWAATPALIAIGVLLTGEASSPVLIWFAVPAVTLGFRFELRGIVLGTLLILALLAVSAILPDPAAALEARQSLAASVALILCTAMLAGALAESDRVHRRSSMLDPLTGLYNRGALEQRLHELDGQPCNPDEGLGQAFLLCDLDNFKRVNDKLGHVAGDAVLQDVADAMRSALRAGDSIYRVGGEEILVILPGAGREDAVEIAERLRSEVHDRRPVGITVTVSIGVAVSEPEAIDTEDLISRADAALYAAKAEGRNAVFCDC